MENGTILLEDAHLLTESVGVLSERVHALLESVPFWFLCFSNFFSVKSGLKSI